MSSIGSNLICMAEMRVVPVFSSLGLYGETVSPGAAEGGLGWFGHAFARIFTSFQLPLEHPVVFVCTGRRKFHLCSVGQHCAQVFLMCAMVLHTGQAGNYLGQQRGCDLTACFRCFQSAEEAGGHCAAALERGVCLTDRDKSHLAVSIFLSGCRKLIASFPSHCLFPYPPAPTWTEQASLSCPQP